MVKLKLLKSGSNPVFEVVIGKRVFRRFLQTVGYNRTSTMFYEIPEEKIVKYEVFLQGNLLYLDYNPKYDFVLVRKLSKEELIKNQGNLKEYITSILEKVLGA